MFVNERRVGSSPTGPVAHGLTCRRSPLQRRRLLYIYRFGTMIAITIPLRNANISIKRAVRKFRCQSPVGPTLARKIPLPNPHQFHPKPLILLLLLVIKDAFWTPKRVFSLSSGR